MLGQNKRNTAALTTCIFTLGLGALLMPWGCCCSQHSLSQSLHTKADQNKGQGWEKRES